MAIFTHGVEKLLYELNFSNNNKFCNVFLSIVDLRSLRCYCYIQNFQIWEQITLLISIFPTMCAFLRKNMTITVYKKERINVTVCFICDDITRYEWDTWSRIFNNHFRWINYLNLWKSEKNTYESPICKPPVVYSHRYF